MIEINSSVHFSYSHCSTELHSLRDVLAEEAYQSHIGICGGGAHPFQKWNEQRIFLQERFASYRNNMAIWQNNLLCLANIFILLATMGMMPCIYVMHLPDIYHNLLYYQQSPHFIKV